MGQTKLSRLGGLDDARIWTSSDIRMPEYFSTRVSVAERTKNIQVYTKNFYHQLEKDNLKKNKIKRSIFIT